MWPLTKHACQNHRGLYRFSHSLKSFTQCHPNLVRWNKHMRWSQIENAAIGASAFTVNRVRYTWWLSSDCYRPPRTTWSSFTALGRRGQTPVGTMGKYGGGGGERELIHRGPKNLTPLNKTSCLFRYHVSDIIVKMLIYQPLQGL